MNQFKELVQELIDDGMSDTVLSIIEQDGSLELKQAIYEFWNKHDDQMHLALELENDVYNEGLLDTKSITFFMELVKQGIKNIKLFKECYQGQYCLPDVGPIPVFTDSHYLAISKCKGFDTSIFEVFKRVKS
tara:strand:+ start:428 stop:823 length:396 start_codon:yes stop_codon:yes gene_type:complete